MSSSTTDEVDSTTQIISLPDIPEFFDPSFLDILLPLKASQSNTNPAHVNPTIKAPKFRGSRQNIANGYTRTGSPVLDAFQYIREDSSSSEISRYLSKAWKEDPGLTLKIIWNLRSIPNTNDDELFDRVFGARSRDNILDGKGVSEVFYRAFGWLYDNHPRTAISNLHLLVEPVCSPSLDKYYPNDLCHGTWNDLLNILCLATRGELCDSRPAFLDLLHPATEEDDPPHTVWPDLKGYWENLVSVLPTLRTPTLDPGTNGLWRARWQCAVTYEQLNRKLPDPAYRALYIQVARLFAERLEKDIVLLKELRGLHNPDDRFRVLRKISLVGESTPDPGGLYDRVCNISTAIAYLHKPSNDHGLPKELSEPLPPGEEARVLRSLYSMWKQWTMTELGKQGYWDSTIQWKMLVEYLKAKGVWENSIAVCDVSRSMRFVNGEVKEGDIEPILPAVALSLIPAHLAKPPFNAGFITFSHSPKFVQLDLSKNLSETVEAMAKEDQWTFGLDLNAVLTKVILPLAVKNKVRQKDMIKRLYVFSNTTFGDATAESCLDKPGLYGHPTPLPWGTYYERIEKTYKKAGYGVPEIVYWDLSTSEDQVEMETERRGVRMFHGFSPATLKLVLGEKEKAAAEVASMNRMRKVLDNGSFAGLKVVD